MLGTRPQKWPIVESAHAKMCMAALWKKPAHSWHNFQFQFVVACITLRPRVIAYHEVSTKQRSLQGAMHLRLRDLGLWCFILLYEIHQAKVWSTAVICCAQAIFTKSNTSMCALPHRGATFSSAHMPNTGITAIQTSCTNLRKLIPCQIEVDGTCLTRVAVHTLNKNSNYTLLQTQQAESTWCFC